MSTGKSTKARTDQKSQALPILSTLEQLNESNEPDRDSVRYCCRKLFRLVINQENCHKDVSRKAGLDIILSTLERCCDDQPTCLTLVSMLSEISNGGQAALKKLVAHDTTRVLLIVLTSIGSKANWKLLSLVMHLLSKIGPHDQRFSLRARLTGSLNMILTTARAAHNRTNSNFLFYSLNVMKLCVVNSSINANYLSKAGAFQLLQKMVLTKNRKQTTTLKVALETLNLIIHSSKHNAITAVNVGLMPQLLHLHQEFHKSDLRINHHVDIRKSILNSIKHIASLQNGRQAFSSNNGLLILYNSCMDYLSVNNINKAANSMLLVATMVIQKCQPKIKFPHFPAGCSFKFALPGAGDEIEVPTLCGNLLNGSISDQLLEEEEEEEDSAEETHAKKRDSSASSSKDSSASGTSRPTIKYNTTKMTDEDLKIYQPFFPELQDFPLYPEEYESVTKHFLTENEAKLRYTLKPSSGQCISTSSFVYEQEAVDTSLHPVHVNQEDETLSADQISGYNKTPPPSPPPRSPSPNYCSGDAVTSVPQQVSKAAWFQTDSHRAHRYQAILNFRQDIAQGTISVKETINRLSQADSWGSFPLHKVENQRNCKSIQRLMRIKILDDISRVLFPESLINKVVFSSEDELQPHREVEYESPSDSSKKEERPSSRVAYDEQSQSNQWRVSHEDQESGSVTAESARDLKPIIPSLSGDPVRVKKQSSDSVATSSPNHMPSDVWALRVSKSSKSPTGISSSTVSSKSLVAAKLSQSTHRSRSAGAGTRPAAISPPLKFESNFESGNLRGAIRIREYEYDLVLNCDCNNVRYFQWFYFGVSGMKVSQSYRFNIINYEKKGSLINEGMQPVMYSMFEARHGRPHWRRVGQEICYYRNCYMGSPASPGDVKGRPYFTLTFTVDFQHSNDTCYFAYHYPYSYSKLKLDLQRLISGVDRSTMYVRNETLCHSLAGNPVPILTITAMPRSDNSTISKQDIAEFWSRPYIFLSARVHPGESNASWMMRGTLRLLLTPPPIQKNLSESATSVAAVADELRRSYIFKIVPMLNPDGVINGHYRCSLSGEDLNRRWMDPDPSLFPTIYHTKGLLLYLKSIDKAPHVFCDYHGHSRKMNAFILGCSHRESTVAGEASSVKGGPTGRGYKTLPKFLSRVAPAFSMKNCSFLVEKDKISTARVVVWKEIGVIRSYTMESTYCGCDQGPLKGKQIGVRELEEMGIKFCEGLLCLKDRGGHSPLIDTDDEEVFDDVDYKNQKDLDLLCPVNSDAELTPGEDLSFLDVSCDDLSYDDKSIFSHNIDGLDQSCTSVADTRFCEEVSNDSPASPTKQSHIGANDEYDCHTFVGSSPCRVSSDRIVTSSHISAAGSSSKATSNISYIDDLQVNAVKIFPKYSKREPLQATSTNSVTENGHSRYNNWWGGATTPSLSLNGEEG